MTVWLLNGTVVALICLNAILLAMPPMQVVPPAADHPGSPTPVPKVFVDAKQTIQLTASTEWADASTAFDEAVLALTDARQESLVFVFQAPKSGLLEKYRKLDTYGVSLREHLAKEFSAASQSPPIHLSINGLPASRSQFDCTVGGNRLVLLHTIVETPDAFVQIRAVSPPPRFSVIRQELLDITSSFMLLPVPTLPGQ